MRARVGHLHRRWEDFLRLDRLTTSGERVRARLIYSVALLFIALQFVNQIVMLFVHGGYTVQHLVSAVACLCLAALTCMLRRTVSAAFFGSIMTFLIFAAIVASAAAATDAVILGGINSALLPILVTGSIFVALLGDWRVGVAYTLGALALVIGLLVHSRLLLSTATHIDPITLATLGKNFAQTAVQASLAIIVAAGVATPFGHVLYRLLDELEDAARTARQAERVTTAFHADMNHEIRSPLAGIIGMTDVLANTELTEHQRKCTRLIAQSGTSLLRILGDVLDIAKLDEGRLQLELGPMDLHEVLDGVCELHRPSAEASGLWLGLTYDTDLPRLVLGDMERLRQVVGNLLGNAIKFTSEGGVRVGVRAVPSKASRDEARLQIYVQDTGVGIAENAQATIFERYTQTSVGRARGSAGTGLGLSIARDLVELMGGVLSLSSEPGRGTVFHFTLSMPILDEMDILSDQYRAA